MNVYMVAVIIQVFNRKFINLNKSIVGGGGGGGGGSSGGSGGRPGAFSSGFWTICQQIWAAECSSQR